MWTAVLELSLRHPDGREGKWSTEVVMQAESQSERVSLPAGEALSGPALLVGFVTFVDAQGRSVRTHLGGRNVELDGAGALVASAERVTGAIGVGLIVDANDAVEADSEMPALGSVEVTR